MATTVLDIQRFPISGERTGVRATTKFTAESDISQPVLLNGDALLQAQGPVDAATIALERSTVDPSGGAGEWVEVDDATGSSGGGVSLLVPGIGNAWYRAKNKATFGPANTIATRSLSSLAAAVNGLQPAANGFAPGTSPQPLVHASVAGLVLTATAATPGAAGNAIATTETLGDGAWGAATLTGGVTLAAAVGTLTFSTGPAADGDTVTINGQVYTFRSVVALPFEVLRGASLTTSRDNLVLAVNLGGTAATGVLTLASNVVAGDTVRIGSRTYTYVAVLDQNIPNQVFIGADLTASRDNLVAAVNGAAGSTAKYSISTPPNAEVTAVATSTNAMTVSAKVTGLPGQSIVTLETSSHASWGAAALAGGTGVGISYGTGTTLNADVTAAAVSTNQMTATAKVAGAAGNAITTTESGANTAWGAATLASGADAVAAHGTLTLTDVPADGETVTIGAVVYTFKDALTPTAGEVMIAGETIDVTISGEQTANV